MKLIILGSSADKGFPNRKGKDKRTRSSIAIQNQDKTIVVDAGPDFWMQIAREKIIPDAIILTHSHPDHTKGLYKKIVNIPVYARKETWDEIPRCKVPKNLRKIVKDSFKIAGIRFELFKVGHSPRIQTYGLVIGCNTQIHLVYIPDFTFLPTKAKKNIQKAQTLVLDGSTLDRDLNVHVSIKKQLKWAKSWPARKIYFTHIGRNTAKHSHNKLIKLLKTLDRRADVFYDGERIEIKSSTQKY